jgi:hypothetical protein
LGNQCLFSRLRGLPLVVVCPTFDMATSLFQLRSYLLSDDLVKAANIEGKRNQSDRKPGPVWQYLTLLRNMFDSRQYLLTGTRSRGEIVLSVLVVARAVVERIVEDPPSRINEENDGRKAGSPVSIALRSLCWQSCELASIFFVIRRERHWSRPQVDTMCWCRFMAYLVQTIVASV